MRTFFFHTVILTALAANSASLDAETIPTQRRLAIIKALKMKGVVGENNRGLLEFRGTRQAEDVVDQENAERVKTYKKIAKNQKVAWEKVGEQRAAQLAKDAPAGTWLQNPDGQWRRKE